MPDTRGEDHGQLYGKSLMEEGSWKLSKAKEVTVSPEWNDGVHRHGL